MEFAFLDESGNRGLKGTKYLVTALMCTSKSKEIVKIIVEAKHSLLRKNKTRKWLNRNGGEIKFYGFPDDVLLRKILKDLSKLDIKIYSLVFEKDIDVDNGSKIFLLSQLFEHIFKLSGGKIPQKILADSAFYGKEKVYRFLLDEYTTWSESVKEPDGNVKNDERTKVRFSMIKEEDYQKAKNEGKTVLTMEQYNSKNCEELQALDLISGTIFHMFEKDDHYLFKIIEPLVKRIIVIKASHITTIK